MQAQHSGLLGPTSFRRKIIVHAVPSHQAHIFHFFHINSTELINTTNHQAGSCSNIGPLEERIPGDFRILLPTSMLLLIAFISSHFYVANSMDFVPVGATLSGVQPLPTEARCKCSFASLWTEKTHPIEYPSDSASWSAPILVVHSD